MKLNVYSDPGHGWAAVPLRLLERLQLLDAITPYSYLRGRYAYLEEDCDLDRFMSAVQAAGLSVEFCQYVSGDRRSRIRGYGSYTGARARWNLERLREGYRPGRGDYWLAPLKSLDAPGQTAL